MCNNILHEGFKYKFILNFLFFSTSTISLNPVSSNLGFADFDIIVRERKGFGSEEVFHLAKMADEEFDMDGGFVFSPSLSSFSF